jgi:hypothetical protein
MKSRQVEPIINKKNSLIKYHSAMMDVAGATSFDDGGGSLSCLLCEVLCVGKVFGFNHKIMINF